MKERIMLALSKVAYDYDEIAFKAFSQVIFTLYLEGTTKQEILDFLTEVYLDDDAPAAQVNVADDFMCRIGGWCTPGKEIYWPEKL